MKSQLLAAPLVAFLPACAMAQTESLPPAPSMAKAGVSIDAASSSLLYRAMQTYKNASGLRLSVGASINGKDSVSSQIAFSRPKLVSVERGSGKEALRLLVDGKDLYIVQGTSYRKQTAPAELGAAQLLGGSGGIAGQLIGSMLDGKNPLFSMGSAYTKAPFKNYKSHTVALAPRVIDGDVLKGVQSSFSFDVPTQSGATQTINEQLTAWFGGSPLALRRVQTRYTQNGKTNTLSEKISNQQISPTFEADAFKFNDAGLKPVSESGGGEEEKYWDARLAVGAEPFAFSAKTLSGATVSPSQYKGKVLLMDFWATWCGPCVASLPELKGAYDKYHAQGLEVVGISLDEDKGALTSFIKTNKMAWPQIYDGKGWSSAVPGVYGVKAIPFMLIIGRDGKIAAVNPRGKIDDAVKAALSAS